MNARTPFGTLTRTQQRIAGLLAVRRSNAQIAAITGLAPSTVKWHISEILSKLALPDRTEVGEWWRVRHGVRPRLWRRNADDPNVRSSIGDMAMEATVHRGGADGFSVSGTTLAIEEWSGSAPGELHVHHRHDIAWHVIQGSLSFRLKDRLQPVSEGETFFVPAGVPHTYGEGEARYLVMAAPELFTLFHELRNARTGRPHTEWGLGPDAGIYRRHDSELLDLGLGRPVGSEARA